MDEPLAVEGAGHRLQNPDAPLAVLDQLVVGRQDFGNATLYWEGGKRNLNPSKVLLRELWLGSTRNVRLDVSVVQACQDERVVRDGGLCSQYVRVIVDPELAARE